MARNHGGRTATIALVLATLLLTPTVGAATPGRPREAARAAPSPAGIRHGDPGHLAAAVAEARAGTRLQAETLGVALGAAPVADRSLTAALLALAKRSGVVPTDGKARRMTALGALPGHLEEALAGVVNRFLAFDRAARRAFAPASLSQGRVDIGPVLAARTALLDAASGLWIGPAALSSGPSTLDLCPAFALDLTGEANTYSTGCLLIVDLAGEDTYTNNAGGANVGAAAVLDLLGNDRYSGGSNGANGGGEAGAGFLLDVAGDDAYSAGGFGTNGGAYFFGAGFLLDAGGNDTYAAGQCGTNGGGCSLGSGFLLDAGGNDSYTALNQGVNGGALGVGRLVDLGGTDAYSDQEGGSGTDRTVAPKGAIGAQLDSTNPAPANPPPSPPPVPSPPATGSIVGTVSDARTKAGIAAAGVDCVIGRAGATVTGPDGSYSLRFVPAATHSCTASAIGYRSKSQQVTVNPGGTTTANFSLRRE